MTNIALAVIAGDDAVNDGIERMLRSVRGKVDSVHIAFTGEQQSVFEKIQLSLNKYDIPGSIIRYAWRENFAEARNFSFEMVEKYGSNPDWIFWLDCDDVLPDSFDIRAAAAELTDRRAHFGLINYDYTIDSKGNVLTSHFKERLFRYGYRWNWIYPIHENCIGPIGTRSYKLSGLAYTVEHHRGNTAPKSERNRGMIARWYKAEPENPRAVMFMAHQTLALAERADGIDKHELLKMALQLYRQFLGMDGSTDDHYVCNNLVADILRVLGRFEDSINIDLQGIKVQPTWPSCYVSIAQTHYEAGQYEQAITWAKMTMHLVVDYTRLQINDRLEKNYKPLMIIGHSNMKLNKPLEARQAFAEALKHHEDDFTLACLGDADALASDLKKLERSNKRSPSELHKLRWEKREGKTNVSFFVPPAIEPWNPDLLEQKGMGGTETCIIKLAQNLAERGCRVAIFGTPGDWDGKITTTSKGGSVEWYDHGYWHPDQPFDIFIGLRAPFIMDTPVNADQKILWLHDLTVGDERDGGFGDRFSMADAIVCPSPFHVKHILDVYGVDGPWTALNGAILNGFDRDLFLERAEEFRIDDRDNKKVVYASSYDRGLTRLLELWPDIAEREPEASLDIYYGWDGVDAIIASGSPNAPALAAFKERTVATIEDLQERGYKIIEHGRVDQKTLAAAMCSSGVMAYPANFQETFGIVFAQALTSGVQIVASDLGAVGCMSDYIIVVPGPPDSENFGPRFVDSVVYAMNDTSDEDRAAMPKYTETMTWDKVTDAWLGLFANIEKNQNPAIEVYYPKEQA